VKTIRGAYEQGCSDAITAYNSATDGASREEVEALLECPFDDESLILAWEEGVDRELNRIF
jgi:hypothetical protein